MFFSSWCHYSNWKKRNRMSLVWNWLIFQIFPYIFYEIGQNGFKISCFFKLMSLFELKGEESNEPSLKNTKFSNFFAYFSMKWVAKFTVHQVSLNFWIEIRSMDSELGLIFYEITKTFLDTCQLNVNVQRKVGNERWNIQQKNDF